MAVVIPQVVTEDRASGAQVIDGGLRFDASKSQYLTRIPSSAGNRRTWTWSAWIKKTANSSFQSVLCASDGASYPLSNIFANFNSAVDLYADVAATGTRNTTSALLRDHSSFYHIVCVQDTTAASDRLKIYVNGVLQTTTGTEPAQNADLSINNTVTHTIGQYIYSTNNYFDGYMSQVYLVDGQALGPEYFGYTDPLTNTWRPKKYTGTYGTNGFYLPMDGNSPIGEDKSGIVTPNNGTFWSKYLTDTNGAFQSSYPATKAFNGIVTAAETARASTTNTTSTWTPPGGISYTSSVEVWTFYNGNVSMNGGSATNVVNLQDWTTIASGSGTLNYLTFVSSSSSVYIGGVRIDGHILIDGVKGNSWTPVNFGGSNTIEKATGALPILNTDGGGKVARPGTRTDANASNLVLALPLVGSANDISNQINSGSTTKAITVTNAVASSAQSNFYGGSYYFDGGGDYLSVASTSDFAFGTGDFTVEMYIYHSGQSDTSHPVDARNGSGGWKIDLKTADELNFYSEPVSGYLFSEGTHKVPRGKWTHFAVVRSSGTAHLFIDGVLKESTAHTSNYSTSLPAIIGARYTVTTQYLSGYLQDIRVYKGVAKYTSNFIPASTIPDILPDTPSGVSGGSKLTKVTDGAVTLSANTDYLDISSSSDFAYGTGDFTIEAYIYTRSSPSANIGIVDHRTEGVAAANDKLQLALITDNTLQIYIDSATLISTTNICAPRSWHHVAYCRSGGTGRIFIDGILSGSASDSYNYGNARCAIGHHPTVSSRDFPGSISNLRIVNGTALYTSNFTPPTRALTNVTNTKLLCCQSTTSGGSAAVSPNLGGVNNGTVWSTYLTGGGGFQSSYPATNAFNGVTTGANTSRSANSQTTQTFTPPGGISYSSSVEVWTWMEGTVSLNGGSNITVSNDQSFRQIATGSGTINNITFNSASGNSVYIAGIRVDGTILLDPVTANGNAAATNFNPFTTDINAVRGQESGYASLNPLTFRGTGVITNNNLVLGATSSDVCAAVTVPIPTDKKIYLEANYSITLGLGNRAQIGVVNVNIDTGAVSRPGDAAGGWAYDFSSSSANSGAYDEGTRTAYPEVTDGDICMWCIDLSAGLMWAGKNGIWFNSGNPAAGTGAIITGIPNTATGLKVSADGGASNRCEMRYNFGQTPFKYIPPDGFQPLNASTARPSTVIARSDQYMKTTLYTGSGPSTAVEVNLGFQPDLVWTKSRTQLYSHYLHDSVRGGNNYLNSDNQNQETVNASNDKITFTGTGYTVFANSGALNESGQGADNVVSWSWKAGGNKNTFNVDDVGYATASAAGLTAGTITPTGASVGTKQGFSIIKYTGNTTGGATVSHGLSQDPKFIMIKNLDQNSTNWLILHTGIGPNGETSFGNAEYNMFRFDNAVPANYSSDFIFPGSNGVFALGEGGSTWSNGAYNYIAYCWHDVSGLQKFGSYTGNASGDGTFVELGFRPALLWIKATGAQGNWVVVDTQRDQYNPVQSKLYADYNGQENASNPSGDSASLNNLDILSNGFKLRSTNSWTNSAQVYVYCAWAEAPSFNLYGAQANAR